MFRISLDPKPWAWLLLREVVGFRRDGPEDARDTLRAGGHGEGCDAPPATIRFSFFVI